MGEIKQTDKKERGRGSCGAGMVRGFGGRFGINMSRDMRRGRNKNMEKSRGIRKNRGGVPLETQPTG